MRSLHTHTHNQGKCHIFSPQWLYSRNIYLPIFQEPYEEREYTMKMPIAMNVLFGTQLQADGDMYHAQDLPMRFLAPGLLTKIQGPGFRCPSVYH